MNIDRLRQLLAYDPETGVLTWCARADYVGKRATWNVRYAGKVAGTPVAGGYVCIRIDREHYLGHRIAWAMTHGEWPEFDLDHRDGDPSNNRIENLRPATHAQNLKNQRRPSNNTSGYKGVSFRPERMKYRASIRVAGRQMFLGHFDTAEAAHSAYADAARREYGEFARMA